MSSHHRLDDPRPGVLTRHRRAGLLLLAAVIGIVALPTVGSASSRSTAAAPSQSRTASAASSTDGVDLDNWYLTLPTGKKGDPDTVYAPELARYSSKWFRADDSTGGIAFTANAGGVTTKGSDYPRSELREMNGAKKASWSNTKGTHTLQVRQAVTAVPKAKPEVVTAQVHDSSDDVLEVRLEGTKLIAQYNDGKTDVLLDPKYALGTVFDVKIVAAGGRIQVFYNGTKKVDIARKGSGWYFKSGSYVQSNTSKGDKASAVGTVVLYSLDVTHTS
jgi:Alginate lyase